MTKEEQWDLLLSRLSDEQSNARRLWEPHEAMRARVIKSKGHYDHHVFRFARHIQEQNGGPKEYLRLLCELESAWRGALSKYEAATTALRSGEDPILWRLSES